MPFLAITAFFTLFLVVQAVPAGADMLEIRNKGFVNGEILSETDEAVQFKDAEGTVQTIARTDILFLEKEAPVKKPLFQLPKPAASPKAEPPAKPKAAAQNTDALSGLLVGYAQRVQEQNAKIEMEKQYLDNEHAMAQAQRAIYNQARPGTFPGADDSWLPRENSSSEGDSSSTGNFRSL